VLRRRKADLLVLSVYAALSFVYFGWRLLPHFGRLAVGQSGDYQIFVWSFAWWPHAIATWTNPFVTHVVYAPSGINLTWTASSPGLALAFSPLTVLLGPTAAYNVAALLLPALAAWTAYLLCRRLTGSVWASLVGGYLFGFSSPMLGQLLAGHLHVTGVFLLPLVALVVVRYVEGELDGRGLAWRLGLLLAAQLWISTEFAFATTLMLALGLLVGFWVFRDARPRLRAALAPICGGYFVGGILAAPFLGYALLGFHPGRIINVEGTGGGADLANLVVPTQTTALGGSSLGSVSSQFGSSTASFYLGLPTLLIVALLALRARRSAAVRFLLAALAITTVIVLGRWLLVEGHKLIPLPWYVATHVPLLHNVLPFHLAAYATLAAAVIVAVWTARTRGRIYPRPYLLPLLAIAALVPAVWRTSYPTFRPLHPDRLAFFTRGLYKTCIPHGATVAIFGNQLLWQAEADFWYGVASGGLAPVPETGKPLTSFDEELFTREAGSNYARPTMDRLLGFAAYHHAVRILATPSNGYPSPAQLRSFGSEQLVGGMLVAPACDRPSFAARNLTRYVASYRHELTTSRPNIGWCTGGAYHPIRTGLYPYGGLAGATKAIYVKGEGITCSQPPAGYTHQGFASPDLGVPVNTYPYYAPKAG
jgi:hypothetical protein